MKITCNRKGFSLTELVVVIAVMGVLTALVIPAVSNVVENSGSVKAKHNAQQIASMSSALESIGVAHVLPESMGGIEASIRLLREGITVQAGPMKNEHFRIAPLDERELKQVIPFLNVDYTESQLRLIYSENLNYNS